MQRLLVFALAMAGLGSAGCGNLDPGRARLRAQLALNRAKWNAADVGSYTYRYKLSCFCEPDSIRPVIITVRSGSLQSVRYADDDTPVDPARLSRYPMVEGLFATIQSAIDENAAAIEAAFDAELGYPTSISIDRVRQAIDDESTESASELTRI